MLGGDPVNEDQMAAKGRANREWGRVLGIAAGNSASDEVLDGRDVLIRPGKIVIRAKPGERSDLDYRIDTDGMDRDEIAARLRGALGELDRVAPLPPVDAAAAKQRSPIAPASAQAATEASPEPRAAAPLIEDVRERAAVLRGVPKGTPPAVPGVSLKWDEKAGGFIFSRKHRPAVEQALGLAQPVPQVEKLAIAADESTGGGPAASTIDAAAPQAAVAAESNQEPSPDASPEGGMAPSEVTDQSGLSIADERPPAASKDPAPSRKSPKKEREDRLAKLRAYFAPGNVVRSFSGTDRVLAFDTTADGDWSVTVESVVKDGDKWVKNPADGRVRTHRTAPSEREIADGPVAAPPPQEEAAGPSGQAEDAGQGAMEDQADAIDAAAAAADPAPTEAQKEAGNYAMGHVSWNGLGLTIETAKGQQRRGRDADGEEWAVTMPAHYGYIKRTEGADGDHVDFYMGPEPESDVVVVVDQVDAETRAFDEHKVMLGFRSRKAALDTYAIGFSDGKGRDRLGAHKVFTVEEFKDWLENGDTSNPIRLSDDQAAEAVVNENPGPAPTDAAGESDPLAPVSNERARDAGRAWLDASRSEREAIVREANPGSGAIEDIVKATLPMSWNDIGDTQKTLLTRTIERRAKASSDTGDAADDAQVAGALSERKPGGTKDKIEDFGEKLGGARKDLWTSYADRIKEAENLDVAAEPLSKSWPEPDYEKLIEAGVDPWSVAFIRSARDYIPRKPSTGWKVKGWARDVENMRAFSRDLMDGKIDKGEVKRRLEASEHLNRKVGGKIALYEAVGHAASLKEFDFGPQSYSMLNGERYNPSRVFWEVTKAQKATAWSNFPRTIVRADTRDEAVAGFKAKFEELRAEEGSKGAQKRKAGAKFIIYSNDRRKTWIVGTKIGSNHIDLRDGIAEVKEARRIIAEEADQLQAKLDRMRDIPNERRDTNDPRIGVDHRAGADVTPQQFLDTFGFRGVEFGNWVEGDRRQADLNNAYDALLDLANIIDLPPKALSLNGKLGLAFGARGTGGKNPAAAHFEPGKVVINLTKRQGRGSLAHEWFHSLDNYFARRRSEIRGNYITDNALPGGKVDGVRPEVIDAFIELRRAIASTGLKDRSKNLDKMRSDPYWSTGIEMHARAFESYVIAKLHDQNASNDYLANLVSGTSWGMMAELSGLGDSYPYLKADEIDTVRVAFDNLFRTIETRETDTGVEMYARPGLIEGKKGPSAPGDDAVFAAEFMAELAQVDDLFAYPKATARTLKGVMAEIDPSVKYIGNMANPDEAEATGADRRYLLRTANGKDFFVFETDDEVWLDVSRLAEGDAGSAIYAAVADYAFNTGHTFIGDPAGLSDIALRRRTDAMLSSALKHGTTRHLAPHQRQIDGEKSLGIPPLNWTEGDTLGNIQALIEVSTSSLAHHIPEIARARYDFESRTFRSGKGEPITDGMLGAWDEHPRVRAARAGRRTLKRGILLNTLLRAESGRKPGLLERALQQPRQLVSRGGGLAQTFYKVAPQDGASIGASDIGPIAEAVQAEVARHGLAGNVSARVVRGLVGASGVPILGRQRGAQIEVAESPMAKSVLWHEIIHALRDPDLWGTSHGLFTPDEWRGLVKSARARSDIAARVEREYADQPESVRTEEKVAELYREWAERREASGAVSKAFTKARALFAALANALRGRGFQSAAFTMERIASGRIGGRGPDGPGGGTKDASDDAGAEMRPPLGSVRAKFAPLIGDRGWRDTPAMFSEWLSGKITDNMAGDKASFLGLIPGRALFSELGKGMLSARRYLRVKEEMDTVRDEWHADAAKIAQKWIEMQKKDPAANDALMDLMHRSTLTGVDPSQPDQWGENDSLLKAARGEWSRLGQNAPAWARQKIADFEARQKAYAAMKELFDALPPEFQSFYVEVKKAYESMADDFDRALEDNIKSAAKIALKRAEKAHRKEMRRIDDDGLTGAERAEAIEAADKELAKAKKRAQMGVNSKIKSLRKIFEGQRLKGPYFPLARFGNFWAVVRDADGKVINFSRFENSAQQRAFMREQEEMNPGRVRGGLLEDKAALRDQVDPKFVADIEAMLADTGASPDLMDAIWQRYLETLPDQSIRTSKIHRKGRAGFSRDALRSFTSHMFHGAHQLARLRYGLELGDALDDAADEAKIAKDPNRAMAIVSEMRRRMAWTMAPTNAPWVAAASSMAFVWYLGVSPAAALVNITQTTVIGPAVMKARFKGESVGAILSELGRASGDFVKGRGPKIGDAWSAENSPSLTGDEVSALKEAHRRGTIDRTQSHDLASIQESGIEFNPVRENIMRKIGWAFHHAERFNREVTFLANYRLARKYGQAHEDAIETAADLTWKIHFSYQNSDRPRAMQGDWPKLFLQFRQFTFNLLYRLFRDMHQSLNGATEADRKEARTQLVGISLSMMAHAGIKGVWGYSIIMGLLALFFPGDADDLEEWMQDALLMEGDSAGVAAWNYAMGAALNGVPGQLTGVALTERIGSPNLWFRGPDRTLEGEDWLQSYVNELLGPSVGIAFSLARGAQNFADGDEVRGVEAITPKFIRDIIKTGRYAVDGVNTKNGDPLIENVNPWELFMQMNGFTPARVAERYEINSRLKNLEKEVLDERQSLHRRAGDALRAGEPIPEKVMDKIRDFNARFPEYPITGDTLRQSIRSRERASQRSEFGISLNPKINDRLREGLAPSLYG